MIQLRLLVNPLDLSTVNRIHNDDCLGKILLKKVRGNDLLPCAGNEFPMLAWIEINNVFYLLVRDIQYIQESNPL